jgi:hypothetical protein
MKKHLLFLGFSLISVLGFSQPDNTLQWQKSYGGTATENAGSLRQTTDGGFIVAGYTESSNGDITGHHGNTDFWVVKTSPQGLIQWQKAFGGSDADVANCVEQTSDGGYIVAGYTASIDGDVTLMRGFCDVWVVKTDAAGEILWQKTYGGTNYDKANHIRQTADGGYIICGMTMSSNGDITANHGDSDYWIVKTDASGAIQWQKTYGGSDTDLANCIQQTTDGGYVFTGQCNSSNGDVTGNHGMSDYWIVKTNAEGAIEWQKCYGGSSFDAANSIRQTSDGGYVVGGGSSSDDGNATSYIGDSDCWIVKTNSVGELTWQKKYGGSQYDVVRSIEQGKDGGYLAGGYTNSANVDVTGNHGTGDAWVFKVDPAGDMVWKKCYGGTSEDGANSTIETSDGAYAFVGYSSSNDGDATVNFGYNDCWLVKGCSTDPIDITVSDLTYCNSTTLTATGGFSGYLWNTGATTPGIVVTSGGNYSVAATNLSGCTSQALLNIPAPIQAFNDEQICMVTMNTTTNKNTVVVLKTLNVNTDSIVIYRADDPGSQYVAVGALAINEMSSFQDETAKPSEKSYQYKIATKNNECEKMSGLSPAHTTMFLQASPGADNRVNLSWSPYDGFGFTSYQVCRNSAEEISAVIATVSISTFAYTDLTPPAGLCTYQVRVKPESPCSPSKASYAYAASNVVKPGTYGIDEIMEQSFTVYPNPATDNITIKRSAGMPDNYAILDQTGRIVSSGNLNSKVSNIDISELSSGIYTFVMGNQGRLSLKIMKK